MPFRWNCRPPTSRIQDTYPILRWIHYYACKSNSILLRCIDTLRQNETTPSIPAAVGTSANGLNRSSSQHDRVSNDWILDGKAGVQLVLSAEGSSAGARRPTGNLRLGFARSGPRLVTYLLHRISYFHRRYKSFPILPFVSCCLRSFLGTLLNIKPHRRYADSLPCRQR